MTIHFEMVQSLEDILWNFGYNNRQQLREERSSHKVPSKASYMLPTIYWQLAQIHAIAVPPSCVSRDEFPINVKITIRIIIPTGRKLPLEQWALAPLNFIAY